jgi:hypothetical protein
MSYPPPPEGGPSEPGSGEQGYGQPGYGSGQPGYGPGHGQPGYPGHGQPGYGQGGPGPPPPYGYDPNQAYGYGQGGQHPYGFGQQGPHGAYYPAGARPEHPGAVPSLVIGIIALLGGIICGLPLVVGPWAWVKGKRTMDEIDASGGRLAGRGQAQAGFVCGIIATVLLGIAVIVLVLAVIGIVATSTP